MHQYCDIFTYFHFDYQTEQRTTNHMVKKGDNQIFNISLKAEDKLRNLW